MPSAAYTDAFVKYFLQFPDKASLGDGTPPAVWQAEYDAIAPGAFDAVTGTALSLEGGNMAGVRNFAQMQLVRALCAVRALRDTTFVNPYTLDIPEPIAGRRQGFVVHLGPGCHPLCP